MDHHPIHDDPQQHQNYVQPAYMYASDEDASYPMVYQPQMPMQNYGVVPAAPQPRIHDEAEMQQSMHFHRSLSMMPPPQQYQAQMYNASPPHAGMQLSASPPSPPAGLYDAGPLSPPLSGSDTSADGLYHHGHSRNSSATGSPSSSRANSLVHRNPLRYNPTPSPTSSSGRRSRGRSLSDDDDMGIGLAESLANTRKEATRRQRIEAEQRRRDELRDGYARLKEVLPVSNQKSSKVSLLERATNYIIQQEKLNRQLQARLDDIEAEVGRLRSLNEKISLSASNTSPSPAHIHSRPLSPPSEGDSPKHSQMSMSQDHPVESSPEPSEG
ncbi:hypothetical protein EIP86_004585 [Pleurotus ostreatoroseus]|nr:hypothetical protein EIP86_004585 [Pleurotus ostreatoroseus]